MKISIITVAYNSENTIVDTIESVLRQTYKDIEYLVIDGGSQDRTIEIVRTYEKRFGEKMRWVSEPDKGIYDAMNKGIRMATGDIVGILNSDDFYNGDRILEKVAETFEQNGTDTVYGNLYMVAAADTNRIVRTWKSSSFEAGSFRKGWHPPHPSFFVKKKIYERYGLFDTSFSVSADFELMLRFLERYHVSTSYLDLFLVKMRIGGESTKSLRKRLEGNKNVIKAFKKNRLPVSIFYPFYRIVPKLQEYFKS